MTLEQFFTSISENPEMIVAYFVMIPLTAAIAGFMGKGEGHLAPWKYLYSTLIYLVCIPGIFAVTLFIFGNRGILQTEVYTQILPLLSMIITLLLISKNTKLDRIPGFGRMSGLVMMIASIMFLMWIAQKMRIVAFTYLPFYYVILIFIGLLIAFRVGFSQLFKAEKRSK